MIAVNFCRRMTPLIALDHGAAGGEHQEGVGRGAGMGRWQRWGGGSGARDEGAGPGPSAGLVAYGAVGGVGVLVVELVGDPGRDVDDLGGVGDDLDLWSGGWAVSGATGWLTMRSRGSAVTGGAVRSNPAGARRAARALRRPGSAC